MFQECYELKCLIPKIQIFKLFIFYLNNKNKKLGNFNQFI